MPRVKPHGHPCAECGERIECGGEWEENYDGFPEVICREYHMPWGQTNPDYICEDCDAAMKAELAEFRRELGKENGQ